MTGSIRREIAVALFGKVRSAVLALLFCNSDRSFYLREIIRHVGAGQGATQRELNQLLKLGLVNRWRVGNQAHYQANSKSSIFPELKSLMNKTSGATKVIHEALAALQDRIVSSFIYGSFAKGTETAESDVDVMVIGAVSFAEVADHLYEAQEELSREINPTVYPVEEFQRKLSERNHFLTSLIDEQKVFLIGDEDEFARLVKERLVG